MRTRSRNRVVRLAMAAALLIAGFPLVSARWPGAPLDPLPGAAAGTEIAAGEIVVDARDTLTPAQLRELSRRHGVELRYNSPHARDEKLLVASVPVGQETAAAERLGRDPLVEAAGPSYRYTLPPEALFPLPAAGGTAGAAPAAPRRGRAAPNDPRYGEQWNFHLIDAEKAWEKSAAGEGVVVAVIDTGVAFETHDRRCYQAKDFSGTRFVPGFDFVNKDEHPNDDHGHGTHVAGTIAETTNNGEGAAGLAHRARIMPLKVLDSFGGGRTADIADAIRFAADHGARVINMSLGGPFPDRVMRLACEYAAKKGVLIVCAAGNSGGGPVGYPAAFPECMAVSSVGPDGTLAPYSSIGKQVAIAAPGGDTTRGLQFGVLQNTVLDGNPATDGYYAFQGTSMASPHVAATAAIAIARGVGDAGEVRQLLQKAATPRKPAVKYGAGVLSAGRTVELADAAARDSWLKLLFTVIAGLMGVGVGAVRDRARGLLRFPFLPLGFLMGALAPDLLLGWLGLGSPFNILLHSALIPLYLLWEADSPAVKRFVAAMALGVALHLGWDALRGHAPFSGVFPAHALPWLWVNTAVGLGVALVAWRRGRGGPEPG